MEYALEGPPMGSLMAHLHGKNGSNSQCVLAAKPVCLKVQILHDICVPGVQSRCHLLIYLS